MYDPTVPDIPLFSLWNRRKVVYAIMIYSMSFRYVFNRIFGKPDSELTEVRTVFDSVDIFSATSRHRLLSVLHLLLKSVILV